MFYATYDVVKKMADGYEEEVRLAKEEIHHDLDRMIQEIMDRIDAGVFRDYGTIMSMRHIRTLDKVDYTRETVLELLKRKFEVVSKQNDDYFKEIIIYQEKDMHSYWIRIQYKHLAYQLKKDEVYNFYSLLHRIVEEEVYSACIRKEKVMLYPIRDFSIDVNNRWYSGGLDFSNDPQVRSDVLRFVMDKLKSLDFDAIIVSKDGAKVNLIEIDEDKFNNNEYWLKINLD